MSAKVPKRPKDPLVKPYLKWAGGKRQLLPEIIKYLPEKLSGLRYFEPFVGAGALFLNRQPSRALINDTNIELMLTYEVIRDHIDELITVLTEHQAQNSETYYYQIRDQDRERTVYAAFSDVRKAARLIYLNKTCYNGLYRVNSQGLFNVPYGRYANPAICDEPVLRSIHRYLNHKRVKIEITNGDFDCALENAGNGSFVYFDPPYHSPDNNNFTGYQAGGFDEEEQERLRNLFVMLTEKGTKCLLSNADTAFIRKIYNDTRFEIIPVKAKRIINSNSSGRGDVGEVLIRNWK